MDVYTITKSTVLYRIEGNILKGADNPKFYAYFRDQSACTKTHWASTRCESNGYCKLIAARPKRDINLLIVPYKTVSFDYVDENDLELGAKLMQLARGVYTEGSDDLKCTIRSINNLILQTANTYVCKDPKDINPDYALIRLLCRAGIDGWIRTANGDPYTSPTHCLDEVAICDPDTKLKIEMEEMIDV